METTSVLCSFILILLQWNPCTGQLMFEPSFPVQDPALAADFRPMRQFPGKQFRTPNKNYVGAPQSPLLHMTTEPKAATVDSESKRDGKNFTFTDLVKAFNDMSEDDEVPEERSSARDYGYPGYGPPQPYGYGYGQRPSYGPPPSYLPPPPSYHESYAPPPPAHHHTASKISLLKPPLDLIKPVTTKVASKVSGLIGLVLALLTGSTPDDLELKGFKDIVINGIVKPLMLAKGGIKSLISKLAIPVISLLLINLEVLITIWWLWEDCPEPVYPPPHQKPSYSYNSNY
nr:uncharacterized protein LOC128673848 [Plodia interpunctella]